MRGFRLFERPVGAFSTLPLLRVVGTLPPYEVGRPYEGRLDILGAVGRCHVEIVEEDSYLPPGSYVYVDNFNQQVVLKWPAYHPPAPVEDNVINGDFQEGMEGWTDLQGNSWEVRKYEDDDTNVGPGDRPRPAGNLAAWMTGAGRGDHVLESIKYPVHPGQSIMARSLWDQGPSNKDNNNLFTALGLYRDGSFIEQVLGDRIHDRTNRTRHWSTVNHVIQPGINEITVRLIAHRRNGRNREIIVDNVETSGLSYSSGTGPDTGDTYCLTLLVRDSANRQAPWSGCIEARTSFDAPVVEHANSLAPPAYSFTRNCVVTLPPANVGDLRVVRYVHYSTSHNLTVPDDWTVISNESSTVRELVLAKVATASDSLTVTSSSSAWYSTSAWTISGSGGISSVSVNTADEIHDAPTTPSISSSSPPDYLCISALAWLGNVGQPTVTEWPDNCPDNHQYNEATSDNRVGQSSASGVFNESPVIPDSWEMNTSKRYHATTILISPN